MVPNVVRLLAGLSLSEVVTTRLSLIVFLSGQKWVVMTSYDLVLAGANKVLSCGNYICVEIPLRVLKAYWKAQMFLLTLPYRCVQRLLSALRTSISEFVDPPIRATAQEILREFLSSEASDKDELIRGIQEIREHSLAAVQRIEVFNHELHRCRNKVQEWKTETEKRTKELMTFFKEEKKLLRVIIVALKHLRRLSGSKAVLDEKFKHTLEDLVNFSRSMSQKREELSESVEEFPGMINANLKSAYNRLQKQDDLLREFTEKKRKVLYRVSQAPSPTNTPSRGVNEFNSTSTPKQILVTDSELVSIGMETLQSIVRVLNAENVILKRRLKLTNDQLDDVKTTSKCLADKVTELEVHLDKVKELLKTTEEERDMMYSKLLSLNEIIEEQEVLLNNSLLEDSTNSLYHTATECLFDESRGSASTSSDCEVFFQPCEAL